MVKLREGGLSPVEDNMDYNTDNPNFSSKNANFDPSNSEFTADLNAGNDYVDHNHAGHSTSQTGYNSTRRDPMYHTSPTDRYDESDEFHPELQPYHQRRQRGYPGYLERGRGNQFFINGEMFKTAKRVVVNPKHFKDWPHYLDYLTSKLEPKFGAIRKICTPSRGHRVTNITQMKPNENYVVLGGEKFKPLPYDQITPSEKKKSTPFNYDASPVVHSRVFQRSAKVTRPPNKSHLIFVCANGNELAGARRVLLSHRQEWKMESILDQVNEILKFDINGVVAKLYDTRGIRIMNADQVKEHQIYVAAAKNQKFIHRNYADFSTRDFSMSPHHGRKSYSLTPLSTSQSQTSPDSTPQSMNGHPPPRRTQRKDDNRMIPVKPVKHTRSSEKVRQVDLDRDEGGMFKAAHNNSSTYGAQEVNEDNYTRTELPIDQRQAYEVEEENIGQQTSRSPRGQTSDWNESPRETPRTDRRQSKDLEEAASTVQAGFRGHKARQEDAASEIQAAVRGKNARNLEENESRATNRQSPETYRERTPERTFREATPRTTTPTQEIEPTPVNNYSNDDDLQRQNEAATKIQAGYKGFKARQEYDRMLEEKDAATEIQAGFRAKQDRKNYENGENKREDTKHSEYSQLNNEEEAVTLIQSTYRSHQERRDFQQGGTATPTRETSPQPRNERRESVESEDEFAKENQAALVIQSNYRGFRERRNFQNR